MAGDKKFDQFTPGGEMQVGDQPVGLRTSDLTKNFIFDFPGTGIKDSNGNYLFKYATAGASAVNYPKLTNSITTEAVIYGADGADTDIDVSIQPKGAGQLILDELKWPAAAPVANASFIFANTDGSMGYSTGSVATAIIGTQHQVLANATFGTPQSGSVTLTTPQDIDVTSSPTFAGLTLSSPLPVGSGGTGHATFTTNGVLFASAPTTLSQVTPANSAVMVTTPAGVPTLTTSMTNGQLLIGNTGSTPTLATLTAGANISIVNAGGSITISGTGLAGFSWNMVTGTSQAMLPNNGYMANNGALVTLTLPATSAVGDEIDVMGIGAGGWKIQAGVGQTIVLGSSTTSSAGSLASTNAKDSLYMICTVANTQWQVASGAQGNITVA
jgi:hypothetical protein